jgi:hypothetical protein
MCQLSHQTPCVDCCTLREAQRVDRHRTRDRDRARTDGNDRHAGVHCHVKRALFKRQQLGGIDAIPANTTTRTINAGVAPQ